MLRSLGALARRLTEQAADLVFLDIHGRMAKLLLTLAEERGKESADGIVLDLNLTQADLAAMVGGSRQSVNQTLRSFKSRGYLDIEGRIIRLKKPAELRRRAGM